MRVSDSVTQVQKNVQQECACKLCNVQESRVYMGPRVVMREAPTPWDLLRTLGLIKQNQTIEGARDSGSVNNAADPRIRTTFPSRLANVRFI